MMSLSGEKQSEHTEAFISRSRYLGDILNIDNYLGVVGYGEGVGYLMSPGRPTDSVFQLGKACYPCSR